MFIKMDPSNVADDGEHTLTTMNSTIGRCRRPSIYSIRECMICGSKAIGVNFGAPTCAPCKAFFRRNARRREVLNSPCQHADLNTNETIESKNYYLQMRRCSSCRLQRCFEVGMREELVRTDEENERHKQLVDKNRKRRFLLKQQQQQQFKENPIPMQKNIKVNENLLNELDWQHLSNIVYAYDTYCLKNYLDRRASMFSYEIFQQGLITEYCTLLPFNLTITLSSFLRTLPAFQSLSRNQQTSICKNNLRRLMLINNHEVNQSCFSETWQIDARRACWKFLTGSELYKDLAYSEQLAEKSWIADPIVTRLWIIVLFFSTSLFCYYDSKCSIARVKKTSALFDRQNAYATLLWKYLLHRHGYMESVRIYSNLIHVYLNMLRVGLFINIHVRSQQDLLPAHETLDQIAVLDNTDNLQTN